MGLTLPTPGAAATPHGECHICEMPHRGLWLTVMQLLALKLLVHYDAVCMVICVDPAALRLECLTDVRLSVCALQGGDHPALLSTLCVLPSSTAAAVCSHEHSCVVLTNWLQRLTTAISVLKSLRRVATS